MVSKLGKMVREGAFYLAFFGVVAAGIRGCVYVIEKTSGDVEVSNPEEIDYDHWPVQVRDYSLEGLSSELYAWDVDEDGQVDGLGYFNSVRWVAPGYEDRFDTHKYTRTMTPEMIEHVSDLRDSHREFSKMLADEAYRQVNSGE